MLRGRSIYPRVDPMLTCGQPGAIHFSLLRITHSKKMKFLVDQGRARGSDLPLEKQVAIGVGSGTSTAIRGRRPSEPRVAERREVWGDPFSMRPRGLQPAYKHRPAPSPFPTQISWDDDELREPSRRTQGPLYAPEPTILGRHRYTVVVTTGPCR